MVLPSYKPRYLWDSLQTLWILCSLPIFAFDLIITITIFLILNQVQQTRPSKQTQHKKVQMLVSLPFRSHSHEMLNAIARVLVIVGYFLLHLTAFSFFNCFFLFRLNLHLRRVATLRTGLLWSFSRLFLWGFLTFLDLALSFYFFSGFWLKILVIFGL